MIKKKISIFIPARLNSNRFPNKILTNISGLPMVEYVRRRAMMSEFVNDVFVTTPDKKVENIIKNYGGRCIRTKKKHYNGTSRVAEACKEINCTDIILLQGDEPLILPTDIDLLAKRMLKGKNNIYNCVGKIKKNEFYDQSVVKAEIDENSNIKDCFRIKKNKKVKSICKLYGLIGFEKKILFKLMEGSKTYNERKLKIEQMRIIDNKIILKALLINGSETSVNYSTDLKKVFNILKESKIQKNIDNKIVNSY